MLFFPVLTWRFLFSDNSLGFILRDLFKPRALVKKTLEKANQAGPCRCWHLQCLTSAWGHVAPSCHQPLDWEDGRVGSVRAGGVWEALASPGLHQLLLDPSPICDPYVQLDPSHNTNSSSQVLAVPVWSPAWGLRANNHPVQGLRVTAILRSDGFDFSKLGEHGALHSMASLILYSGSHILSYLIKRKTNR